MKSKVVAPHTAPALSRTPLRALGRRTIHFPVMIKVPKFARMVVAVARSLAVGDVQYARKLAEAIEVAPGESSPEESGLQAHSLRARVLSQILLDLNQNGWEMALEDESIYVSAPVWSSESAGKSPTEIQAEKARVRASLAARVQGLLERPATRKFIAKQEGLRVDSAGQDVSILSLIADGTRLAESLQRQGPSAIQPYLQVADEQAGQDEFTGLRLIDVFRYFRYYWSFPYESTPGRTLPILIRDAGQPRHPICGLLCLTSPVPKLSVRDASLGWSSGWLEAVVAGLDLQYAADHRAHLSALWACLKVSGAENGLSASRVFADLAKFLCIEHGTSPEQLSASLAPIDRRTLNRRAARARTTVVNALIEELRNAIRAISPRGLGVRQEAALAEPGPAVEHLEQLAKDARAKWVETRSVATRKKGKTRDHGREALFKKKRARQLASLLRAWDDLARLRVGEFAADDVRQAVFGVREPWAPRVGLSGGERVSRGLSAAIAQFRNRLVASQVADVSVCGALPPYGPLLGGKLAALLALSADAAALYHERYDGQVSEIGSAMAGRPITRPAELVSLVTTSFYSVGSSQYNRVALPHDLGSVRWEYVGRSKGNGTLHISRLTTELLQRLLGLETGARLITSTFGEGPSERMRKVRDGLVRLGLPSDEILNHGVPRLVFVAEFTPEAARPGRGGRAESKWRSAGPTADEVAEYWRDRWLAPRLARAPALLTDLEDFDRKDQLLSRRLSPWAGDGSQQLPLFDQGGTA